MKHIVIKEIEKGMGDILILHDNYDVVIQDAKHPDNSITLTKKEAKVVLRELNNLLK